MNQCHPNRINLKTKQNAHTGDFLTSKKKKVKFKILKTLALREYLFTSETLRTAL